MSLFSGTNGLGTSENGDFDTLFRLKLEVKFRIKGSISELYQLIVVDEFASEFLMSPSVR